MHKYISFLLICFIKPKNWVGLTYPIVRAVQNAVQRPARECRAKWLDKVIKTGIYSSAVNLKVVIEGL